MSARKTSKTSIVSFVEEQSEKLIEPMPDTGRPYILESAQFAAYISKKRLAAAREIDEIDAQISRLHVEIEARLDRRKDLMSIVIKADAALGVQDRPSPTIEQRSEPA